MVTALDKLGMMMRFVPLLLHGPVGGVAGGLTLAGIPSPVRLAVGGALGPLSPSPLSMMLFVRLTHQSAPTQIVFDDDTPE